MAAGWAWLLGLGLGVLAGWVGARRRWPWGSRRSRGPRRPERRQLQRWLDGAPFGWLLVDGEGVIRGLNPRAERLLQLRQDGLHRGEPLERVCRAPELGSAISSARSQQRLQRLEWDFGEEDLELHALPGEDGWVAVFLQNRRSLEAQLQQQERWVSDVAHELRTPLTALLLVGDSLADQVHSRHAVLVERLRRELLRLQQLVGDLLELSRLENALPGEGRRAAPVDLAALVEQVWMGLRPLAEPAGVGLQLRCSPDLSPRVWGEEARLHRALLNLLDNALRFSPENSPVEVELLGQEGWILLQVRDHGPGLSERDLEHMFDRFYRGDPSRVRSRRVGSGLGLAIVQQIAVTHGGRVQARNHSGGSGGGSGGGAVLELWLPRAPLAPPGARADRLDRLGSVPR
ncbi:MAG: ATP-binding protein [Synechococcus sp.]